MSNIANNTSKLIDFISEKFEKNELDNSSLVQLIELCGSYLNLQTIPKYAKRHKMNYNGAKNFRNKVKLFDVIFILDND